MKYGSINATSQQMTMIECDSFGEAKRACGIGNVDFGTLVHTANVGGIQIAVDEFGMFKPAGEQVYFAIGRRLFAGNALLFAINGRGETVDLSISELEYVPVRYFEDAHEVERAIAADEIDRPEMCVNGELFWQWPWPRPDFDALAARAMKATETDVRRRESGG
jgi:hypothetical protein